MGIEKKYFTGNNIKKCLIDLGIPYNLILNMNILFNRRNNNEISHSSTKSNYVTKSEYISLKNNFKNLIKEIKNKVWENFIFFLYVNQINKSSISNGTL